MTIPYERTRAVLYTRQFLLDVASPSITKGVPKLLRERARSLLRHYPTDYDLDNAVNNYSGLFECPFTKSDAPFV